MKRLIRSLIKSTAILALAAACVITPHGVYTYATADVSCLREMCMYWPPAKRVSRYAGLAVSPPVPPVVERALLSFEAKGYYEAWAVSPRKVAAALYDSGFGWNRVQNTSGIEQQIAKNVFVGSKRSLWRKYREAIYAVKLGQTYSKRELLQVYASMAQTGPNEYGFFEAAHTFFRKSADQLTLVEALLIVQMLPNPQERVFRYYSRLCDGVKQWLRETMIAEGATPLAADASLVLLSATLIENRKDYPYTFRQIPLLAER